MPIYEYYCPNNHTIYQFYAKTLAQGASTPKCPDNPKFPLRKVVSAFAITKGGGKDENSEPKPATDTGDPAEDAVISETHLHVTYLEHLLEAFTLSTHLGH